MALPTADEAFGPATALSKPAAKLPTADEAFGKPPAKPESLGYWKKQGYEAVGAGKEVADEVFGIISGIKKLTQMSPEEIGTAISNIEWSKIPGHVLEKVYSDVKAAKLGQSPQTAEEAEEKGRGAVRVAGDVVGAKQLGELALQGAGAVAGTMVGGTGRASEAAARALEKSGIKLEARQVKASDPEYSSGFGEKNVNKNQSVQNKQMAQDTGRAADIDRQIDREFIDERMTTLGNRYKKIYTKDRQFEFSQSVIDELRSFFTQESSIGPAGAAIPKRTAGNILDQFTKSPKGNLAINGEGLQRLRTDLLESARSATGSAEKNMAYKLVGMLDDTVEANYPGLKGVMKNLNKQYRATIALKEMESAGIIKNGDISGHKAGAFLRKHPNIGTQAQQEFASNAESVKLQARWESPTGKEIGVEPSMWKTAMRTINLPPRTQAARMIQSRIRARMRGKKPEMMTTAEDQANAADIEAFAQANAASAAAAAPAPPAAPAPFNNMRIAP